MDIHGRKKKIVTPVHAHPCTLTPTLHKKTPFALMDKHQTRHHTLMGAHQRLGGRWTARRRSWAPINVWLLLHVCPFCVGWNSTDGMFMDGH